jgi:cell division protease FtsH
VLGRNHDMPFLGRELSAEPDYSEEVAREIDEEIRRVIEDAHQLACGVLQTHMDGLHRLSAILIEHETIDRNQFERLLSGEPEETVFPEPEAPGPDAAEEPRARLPRPRPRPQPLPGTLAKRLPPDAAGA